jgi:hypothetical protein
VLDAYQWTHSGWPGSNVSLAVLLVVVASSAHRDGIGNQAQLANVGDKTWVAASAIASDRHIQAGTGESKHRFYFIFWSEFASADFDESQHYSPRAFGILRGNGPTQETQTRRSAPTRRNQALGVSAGDGFRSEAPNRISIFEVRWLHDF